MLGVAAAAAAMLMAGCQEEKESPTLMSLAVNDTTMNVTAKARLGTRPGLFQEPLESRFRRSSRLADIGQDRRRGQWRIYCQIY